VPDGPAAGSPGGVVPAAHTSGGSPAPRTGMFGGTGTGDTSGFGGLVRPLPVVPSTPRPFDEANESVYSALERGYAQLDDAVERVVVDRGEMTIFVRREALLEVLSTMRDSEDLRYELLSSVSGVDYLGIDPTGRRLRIEVSVAVEYPRIPSATSVYPTADWHERETWDLLGIVYEGHPGLTRIMMPDDWNGHPQRKDYPLGGIPVEYKGAAVPPPDLRRAYA
jgi:NADH-quinone oxidoreductase subunit C